MTDYFVDYANGNAGNAGTSWATAKKKVSDFASGSMVGGDRIKVAKTPDAYSIGNGAWTSISDYGDVEAKTITSSTNASPIVMTINSHGYSTGDLVWIYGHGTNTNARGLWEITKVNDNSFSLNGSTGNGVGSGGTCTKCNYVGVKPDTIRWKIITDGQTPWTGGTGLTMGKSENNKWGSIISAVTSAAVTTARKIAYFTIPTTDFSAYEQIGFMFYSTGTITAGTLTINLCSDTTGDTVVDSINIPAYEVANKYATLLCDKGSALGSSIQSIAIYSTTSFAGKTMYFNRFAAFLDSGNANEINNAMIVGKGGLTGDWFASNAFTDSYILLGGQGSILAYQERGYHGTTESDSIYLRKPLVVGATDTYALGYVTSNPSGNPIIVSCGWNTSTDTQDGQTVYDQKYYSQNAYYTNIRNHVYLEKFWAVGFSSGINGSNVSYHKITDCNMIVCSYAFRSMLGDYNEFDNFSCNACLYGFTVDSSGGTNIGISFTNALKLKNCGNSPFSTSQILADWTFDCDVDSQNGGGTFALAFCFNINFKGYLDVSYNGASNFSLSACDNIFIKELISEYGGFSNNTSMNYINNTAYVQIANSSGIINEVDIGKSRFNIYSTSNEDFYILGGEITDASESNIYMRYGGELNLRNVTLSGPATEINFVLNGTGARVFSEKHDGTANNHKIFQENGLIAVDTGTVYSSSPYSWKFSPTSSAYKNVNNPINMKLIKVYCEANVEKTVTCMARRDNTGITAGIKLRPNQLSGLTTEVKDEMTASADTWEELSISFTPTESGVVCIEAYAYGGSTYNAWFDEPEGDKNGYVHQGQPFHVETVTSGGETSHVFG